MNGLLASLSFLLFISLPYFIPVYGGPAVLVGGACALAVCFFIKRSELDQEFLMQVFVSALLVRVVIASAIFVLRLQGFFGGDAITYDQQGHLLSLVWQGQLAYGEFARGNLENFLGMPYLVASIYTITGRNMLAVQFLNSVLGAATAPVVYICTPALIDLLFARGVRLQEAFLTPLSH